MSPETLYYLEVKNEPIEIKLTKDSCSITEIEENVSESSYNEHDKSSIENIKVFIKLSKVNILYTRAS